MNPENKRIQNNKKLMKNTLIQKNKILNKILSNKMITNKNTIDKTFYQFITSLNEQSENNIFYQIKTNFLRIPKEIQLSLED